jgi:uncharacterized protein (DUF488 family)
MKEPALELLTIGHSSLSYEGFVELLRAQHVSAVADVRSAPASRRFPHFNRETLRGALNADGIAYAFLGAELGGRPRDPALYTNGVADYEKMAETEEFARGIERVMEGAQKFRAALMCSERDPLDCHRCLLVARALAERSVAIGHILSDGDVLPHAHIENRLLAAAGLANDLLLSREQALALAYRKRSSKAAFQKEGG